LQARHVGYYLLVISLAAAGFVKALACLDRASAAAAAELRIYRRITNQRSMRRSNETFPHS